MKLDDTDVCERSKKLELQASRLYRFSPRCISALEDILLDVYDVLHPRKVDYDHRRQLIRVLDSMAKEIYGNRDGFPKVESLGSYVMDMFTPKSDLDLSLNFGADDPSSFPREKKISALQKFANVLYAQQREGNVVGVRPVLKARVPVLKVVDRGTGIECDISVENQDGISKSLMISFICQIDRRFRILCVLAKAWAKGHWINSPKDRTLSSLSIILLVALHFQTRDPPILPPFSAILRDGPQPSKVQNMIKEFKHFGRANKETLAELFISFLIKLSSVRSLWELGLCASAYEGSWISKQWGTSKIGVEDFLDRSQNCARAVGKKKIPMIHECIERSLDLLLLFMNGNVRGSDIQDLLFGHVSLHTRHQDGIFSGLGRHKRSLPRDDPLVDPVNGPAPKKMHYIGPTERPFWPGSRTTAPFVPHHLAYQNLPPNHPPELWGPTNPAPWSTPADGYLPGHPAYAPLPTTENLPHVLYR